MHTSAAPTLKNVKPSNKVRSSLSTTHRYQLVLVSCPDIFQKFHENPFKSFLPVILPFYTRTTTPLKIENKSGLLLTDTKFPTKQWGEVLYPDGYQNVSHAFLCHVRSILDISLNPCILFRFFSV